jgi:uncharacterized protein
MQHSDSLITATAPTNRILSIDLLRGVAVLGILIMNIQSLSMISAAYINPTAFGDLTGINKWVWIISHMIAAEKFMSIFSMLFGAGVLLLYGRIKEKGGHPATIHYRRNLWLLIFGLIHAYLIWYGDILVAYSLCAFLVYIFRKLKPGALLGIGAAFFIVPMLLYLFFGSTVEYWPEESYNQNLQSWMPGAEKVMAEVSAYQGGYLEQMGQRVPSAIFMQTFLFFMQTFWRVVAMMLLGMALFKWKVLSGQRSRSFYLRMVFIGLLIGYAIVGFGIHKNFEAEWLMDYSMFIGSQFNYIGSVAVALGYVGIVMLISKSSCCGGFKRIFTAVGKMAFTNYILMSVIASFIFYGHGFGLFGQVERWQQAILVVLIWIIVLIISPLWLKYYRFGPLEWLWRVLTYWKGQKMIR